MKLLSSSPSISSSSSSTISFDPKICTPKSATAGCLSGILRRMFCSRTLPTYPSDHITEANSIAEEQFDVGDVSKVTPGIVGRLMGLDYLPELHPNSITRSRSMNSADYKQDTGSIHGKHRRVNSTLSLRDMPTYFELENEEFFVLSFEKRSKERKCREKENRVEKKNEEDDEQASKKVLNLCLEMKGSVADGAQLRKKRRKLHQPVTQHIELAECSSEDSSPVSVLVFDQFIIDHDVSTSGLNPRRKLSADLENYTCKSPCKEGNLMEDDDPRENTIEEKHLETKKKEWHSEKNLEVYDEICRVIEDEVAKSTWLGSNNEEFEDVTADFGSKILNQLLDELVIQFSGI